MERERARTEDNDTRDICPLLLARGGDPRGLPEGCRWPCPRRMYYTTRDERDVNVSTTSW